jgi:hypothetical protein
VIATYGIFLYLHYGALSKRGASSNCLQLHELYQVWGVLSLSAVDTDLTLFQHTTCWCMHEYSHYWILMLSMRNPSAKVGISGCWLIHEALPEM